jgi:hypothetical protein
MLTFMQDPRHWKSTLAKSITSNLFSFAQGMGIRKREGRKNFSLLLLLLLLLLMIVFPGAPPLFPLFPATTTFWLLLSEANNKRQSAPARVRESYEGHY